ncbi:hypothetical protein H1R20_g684, partial [Candolleomyces eurysporus]
MDVDKLAKGKVKPRVIIKISGGKPGETSKTSGEKQKTGEEKQKAVEGKAKETAKQRPCTSREEHKHGKTPYDPAKDSDSSSYEEEHIGAKRKRKSGQKESKSKKAKSVAILSNTDSESEIPIIKQKSLSAKKPGQNIGQVKTSANIPHPFSKEIRNWKEPFTIEEKEAHNLWLAGIIKTNLEMKPKKERKYCPFWCFVIDQDTSYLMCVFFCHSMCKKNSDRVMDVGAKGAKKPKPKASQKGKSEERPSKEIEDPVADSTAKDTCSSDILNKQL